MSGRRKTKDHPPQRGRPRTFDREQALDRAMRLFWEKGYEGASMAELTAAMGVNRPSLYAAFGGKEELFRQALDRYEQGPAAYSRAALEEPTGRRVAERLLREAADMLSSRRHPGGCLTVQGALACGDEAAPVRRELARRRAASEAALRKRLERAAAEGDLPAGSDPGALALYLTTIVCGMAVKAAGGATRRQLERMIEVALRSWPQADRSSR